MLWLLCCLTAAFPPSLGATEPDIPPGDTASAPAVREEEAKTIVLNALRTLTTKPFRMSMYLDTTTAHSQQSVSRMGLTEFVPPDRIRTRMTTSSGKTSETIRIGNTAYSRQANSKWDVAQPLLAQQTIVQMMEQTLQAIEKGAFAVEFLRSEDVNGEATNVYTVLSSTKMNDVETQGTNTLWIRTKDGLLVKQTSEVTPQSRPGVPQVKMKSVQTYEYDATITIDAPIQ